MSNGLWDQLNIKSASDAEQTEALWAQMGRTYASFYTQLVAEGVPHVSATELTKFLLGMMIQQAATKGNSQ